jgi:dCMP deaminase
MENRMNRPSPETIFLDVAETLARRSTCSRGQVGCVITKDNRIIATGYNGALPGARHCDHSIKGYVEDLHGNPEKVSYTVSRPIEGDVENGTCSNALHAELNAVANAARFGVALEGAIAYVSHRPCRACYRTLRAAGVDLIIHRHDYHRGVAPTPFVKKEGEA